jgi:hypothetical protein
MRPGRGHRSVARGLECGGEGGNVFRAPRLGARKRRERTSQHPDDCLLLVVVMGLSVWIRMEAGSGIRWAITPERGCEIGFDEVHECEAD